MKVVGSNRSGVGRARAPSSASLDIMRQNKARGFACANGTLAKPGKPHSLEFCD
jgi:hypothetical protein